MFSAFVAKDMALNRLSRGKEAKHFPLMLLKNFLSYYRRRFDDGSIESELKKLEPHIPLIRYLRETLNRLEKLQAPRKFLKQQ